MSHTTQIFVRDACGGGAAAAGGRGGLGSSGLMETAGLGWDVAAIGLTRFEVYGMYLHILLTPSGLRGPHGQFSISRVNDRFPRRQTRCLISRTSMLLLTRIGFGFPARGRIL